VPVVALRSPGRLAPSALQMGAGVVAVGLGGFVFLAIVGNSVSTSDKVALTSLYMIVNLLGPGLFMALEFETNRVVSSGLAARIDPRDGERRAALLGAALAGAVVLILLAVSPVLVDRNLGGHVSLLVAVLVGVTTSAAVYFARGVLAGQRRFDGYAVTLFVEGMSRLVPCVAVALAGSDDVAVYGMIFASGTGFAAVAAWPWLRRPAPPLPTPTEPTLTPTEPAAVEPAAVEQPSESRLSVHEGHSLRRIARGVALLGVATLLSQVMANLAPLVVNGRMSGDTASEREAVAFGFAFVLTRIPVLLFAPVQAMLLPRLTAAVVRGDLAAVRAHVRLGLLAIAAVGLPGAVGSAVLGPWVVQTLFGSEIPPSHLVMGLLGLSTVLLTVVQIVQPALVASGHHHTATVGWVSGTVALLVLLALPVDPIAAAVIAQLVGPAIVVAVTALGLRAAIGERVAATSGGRPLAARSADLV
jgi:O-antigen/teichoic acid export membrane protein